METIITETALMAINIACAFINIRLRNYYTSLFSAFAAGACFMGVLAEIIRLC